MTTSLQTTSATPLLGSRLVGRLVDLNLVDRGGVLLSGDAVDGLLLVELAQHLSDTEELVHLLESKTLLVLSQ